MSTFNTRKLLAGIALLGLMLGGGAAQAAGTLSGTSITNTATLVTSTETTSSNSTAFTVDNKVKVTVTETNNTATLVISGATSQVVTYTVTNDGNTTQDYQLTAANVASGATLFSTTDTFDTTNCSARVDGNSNGTYESGSDTATFLDEIGPDITTTVFIVCDIGAQANNAFAIMSLMATTADAGAATTLGAITTETSGANTSGIDVVFADTSGSETVDVARDGIHSARDAYVVSAATVTVNKNVALICDPFNYNTNAKFIPGAYVQYTITLTNTSSTVAASLTSLSDSLNSNTVLDPDLRQGSVSACESSSPLSAINNSVQFVCSSASDCQFSTGSGTGTTRYATHTTDADGVSYTGTAGVSTGTVNINFGTMGDTSLQPLATMNVKFNAIIQ
jgi:hypothetical protein